MVIVYVLEGNKGKRYVGITNDLSRRLDEHRRRHTRGGQVIGSFLSLHSEEHADYVAARKREKFLKSGQGREFLNTQYPRSGPASGG